MRIRARRLVKILIGEAEKPEDRWQRRAPLARICNKPVVNGQHANARCNRDAGHAGACDDSP